MGIASRTMSQNIKRLGLSEFIAILFMLISIIITAESVPASVLVQDAELKAPVDDQNTHNDIPNLLTMVKRSNNGIQNSPDLNNMRLKKSSQEIIPSTFQNKLQTIPTNSVMPKHINKNIHTPVPISKLRPSNPSFQNIDLIDLNDDLLQQNQNLPKNLDRDIDSTILYKRGVNTDDISYGIEIDNENSYSNRNPFLYNTLFEDVDDSHLNNKMPLIMYSNPGDVDIVDSQVSPNQYRYFAHNQDLLAPNYDVPISSRYSSFKDIYHRPSKYMNKFEMRVKRDTRLTPADMLALVALVEAERARKDSDSSSYDSFYPRPAPINDHFDDPMENSAVMQNDFLDYSGQPIDIPRDELLMRGNRYDQYKNIRPYLEGKNKRTFGKIISAPFLRSNAYGMNSF